ncbi:4870_t:CDS:2, partial [Diversispora eburnea]
AVAIFVQIKIVDHGKISRDLYKDLTIADYHLTREYVISNKLIEITNYINQKIKFSLVDMKEKDILENIEFEESNITDPEIVQEVLDTMGLGVCRSVKDILYYIISHLQRESILDLSNPIIHLRISGNGKNIR